MAKKKKQPQTDQQLPGEALDIVRARAEALASENGLAVHDVVFGPTDLGLTLSVIIRSAEEGKALSVTDCELISRPLSKELDTLLEAYPRAYMFEVSSMGIDGE